MDYIKKNLEKIKKTILDKGVDLDINELIVVDEKRRVLVQHVEELRARRNEIANQMKQKRSDSLISEGRVIKQQLSELESELAKVKEKFDSLYTRVPNIPADGTPIGKDDKDNVEIEKWGELPNFDFETKDHMQLGKELDLIDFESGVEVAGSRGYYLKNELALMHFGLMWLGIRKMVKHGFNLHVSPTMIREFALFGTGYFPGAKDNTYQIAEAGEFSEEKINNDPHYLAGTSEMALLGMFNKKTFDESELPIKVCGISPCYRSEVGSYGKDTQGLYRVHEFFKVEQVMLTRADLNESEEAFNNMLGIAKDFVEDLELPYHVVNTCTGDMGAGKYKMYDIEVWMPSRNAYGETHSNSNLTDWQAKRMGIKYKEASGGTKFVHTLNNTVIASPRILIAILENNQQKDGSVLVPKILQEFVGKEFIKPKK